MIWKHCSHCGKDFICNNPEPYVYVIKGGSREDPTVKFYCSYTCWRAAKKQQEQEMLERKQQTNDKRRKTNERK